jgi:hypothetical protein
MFISQTGLTYFYRWLIMCKVQILNVIMCGSGICNQCDHSFAKSLWNQGVAIPEGKILSPPLISSVNQLQGLLCLYVNML